MIVVDTSVWIDFFRGNDTAQVARCVELIDIGAPIALTGVILTEVLQGISSARLARSVELDLHAYPILGLDAADDYVLAADLYRRARARGKPVRRTADCLIAASCITHRASILHRDADFDRLAASTELRVFE